MRTVSVNEIVLAIDEARAREPGGAIAFDGDGTLWSGDVGEDFFEALLARGVRDAARDALVREAAEEGIDASGDPRAIARRIHAAYLAGSFPEERVCEIMTWAAAGWSRAELDRFCEGVVVSIGLRDRLHGEAIHVVEHARRVGIDVLLVSASPRAIVEQAARVVGIDLANAMAAREAYDAVGIVQSSVERPIPYGPGKVTHLRARLGAERVLYAAFGDNAFDVAMLREARHPVAVRPKARLVERAAEVPELVVLERA
ncbi:MAG: haloacid dehalogenase-like hydrolase [Labilithrix sp.]|nr:haloacid dehalogenase-like hydrolase [Labilithrix sp.]